MQHTDGIYHEAWFAEDHSQGFKNLEVVGHGEDVVTFTGGGRSRFLDLPQLVPVGENDEFVLWVGWRFNSIFSPQKRPTDIFF